MLHESAFLTTFSQNIFVHKSLENQKKTSSKTWKNYFKGKGFKKTSNTPPHPCTENK